MARLRGSPRLGRNHHLSLAALRQVMTLHGPMLRRRREGPAKWRIRSGGDGAEEEMVKKEGGDDIEGEGCGRRGVGICHLAVEAPVAISDRFLKILGRQARPPRGLQHRPGRGRTRAGSCAPAPSPIPIPPPCPASPRRRAPTPSPSGYDVKKNAAPLGAPQGPLGPSWATLRPS